MPRTPNPNRPRRIPISLTTLPAIRDMAFQLAQKRRCTMSQLFEDLMEAEWLRVRPISHPPGH
jgi:hypothetical protein